MRDTWNGGGPQLSPVHKPVRNNHCFEPLNFGVICFAAVAHYCIHNAALCFCPRCLERSLPTTSNLLGKLLLILQNETQGSPLPEILLGFPADNDQYLLFDTLSLWGTMLYVLTCLSLSLDSELLKGRGFVSALWPQGNTAIRVDIQEIFMECEGMD